MPRANNFVVLGEKKHRSLGYEYIILFIQFNLQLINYYHIINVSDVNIKRLLIYKHNPFFHTQKK